MMSTTVPPRASALSHYPDVSVRASAKEIQSLDVHCKKFISLSPFCILSTATSDAAPDLTPRGGLPGFVFIEDDNTLMIPDRPGNNRLDNLGNLAKNPNVALLFMIPGVNETLRVRGTGSIMTDADLCAKFTENNAAPRSVLKITVTCAFLHCAKAFMRSNLWSPDAIIDRAELPSMGKMLKDQMQSDAPHETQSEMEARYLQSL
ncbi:pyridoxamine 5'-phosphate oxidase family protein [Thalassospira lucentensis]|uniref:pyridoxamine 5'-phosphate oxidase family protein n=1 Tax=Thalassospira lucentensis TaxID=168935 RepID=UPI003D2F1915